MKYKVINAQAKLKRNADFKQFALQNLPLQDNSTQDVVSFHELKNRLSQLVFKLPEKCRITYQLSREQGYSQKEIAAKLSISEKGVEANLARALKSLRLGINQLLSCILFFIF